MKTLQAPGGIEQLSILKEEKQKMRKSACSVPESLWNPGKGDFSRVRKLQNHLFSSSPHFLMSAHLVSQEQQSYIFFPKERTAREMYLIPA